MAGVQRMQRSSLPHCRIFREKYQVIDDLVKYTLNRHLQEIHENSETSSGFTVPIGKLVCKILDQFRRNELFQRKMQNVVDKCKRVPNSLDKLSTVLEQATHFVPLLELKHELFYFIYFAVTCELCARFADTELDEFMVEVKESAKVALFVYWDNASRCANLDEYAKAILSGRERNFCEGKHFDVLKYFLTR